MRLLGGAREVVRLFRSPPDADFIAEGLERCRRGLQVFCAFAVALVVASVFDTWVAEPEQFATLLRIRLLGLAGVSGVFILLANPLGKRYPRLLALLFLVLMSATMHALALETGGPASPQYDRMSLLVLGIAVFLTWSPWWTAIGSGVVMGTLLIGHVAGGESGLPQNLGRLLAANVAAIVATAVREQVRWRSFRDQRALRESRSEVQRLNDELEQRVQRRTAELRLSEARFRTIFESAPIGILTADRHGRIRDANRALESMLGYGLAELQERTLPDLTWEADRARAAAAYAQLCAQSGGELLIDRRYVARDGTLRWAHEAFAVVRDAQGGFDYVLGMVEDVTERQRAEEGARRHREQLAHVLRVNTVGEMAAELAHELNQPLGAIANYANGTLVRLRACGVDPAIEGAVAQIADEALRAGEIIRRIREFVRRDASRREQADVNHLVRQAAYLVEPDARGRGIPLRLALDSALPPVEVDRTQVEQVVLNLLRNALDAIGTDHRVNDEVLVQTSRVDGGIAVTVRDTGAGLPPHGAARIFDAFFTTKRGGLGMGLSISRSIVEAHGGRIWAADNPDRGMSFTFSLPL